MQPNRRVSDRRGGNNRLDKIQAAQAHVKDAMLAHEYKLDAMQACFKKVMTVIYQLRIASEGARSDSQRQERIIEEINHRLTAIELNLKAVREHRRVS